MVHEEIEDPKEEKCILPKNPLQNEWTLWYFKDDRTRNWSDNLLQVTPFRYVEDFWALYNYIEPASRLQAGCDYCVFKSGIKPQWEDPLNQEGGRWLFVINKGQNGCSTDGAWLEVLLCLIGEAFGDDSNEICGAVVNVRRSADKICVWTGDCNNKKAVINIGNMLKERTKFKAKIIYESHRDWAGPKRNCHLYQLE